MNHCRNGPSRLPYCPTRKGTLDREFGRGLQLFRHSVGNVATVSNTITSNPRFISSETLKPPRATNTFGPTLARQRSAACLAFEFKPAMIVACCIASFVANVTLWALPPAS